MNKIVDNSNIQFPEIISHPIMNSIILINKSIQNISKNEIRITSFNFLINSFNQSVEYLMITTINQPIYKFQMNKLHLKITLKPLLL